MAQLKALVVDDASFVRDLVKRTIRNSFPTMALEEAINGKKAQAIMLRTHFDLILCDWEMPEMSGLELLEWARQHDAYKTTPFIMVTSRGDRGHVMEAVQKGVSGYLGKPFSAEQLSSKIIKALGKKLKGAPKSTGSPLTDAFAQSASLLTAAPAKPSAPVNTARSGADVLLGASTPTSAPAEQNGSVKSKGIAEVRFASGTLRCVIKNVSLTEIRVVAKREQVFPGILETAVVDIEFEPGNMARLNGYVHQLQAVDKRMDTDFISLIVRFVDEDPEKLAQLSKYVAKMT